MKKQFEIMQSTFLSNQTSSSSESPSLSESSNGSQTEVVSFCRFIPLHATFLNQPTTPNYLENVFTNEDLKENNDVQLVSDLQIILEMYIKKGRDERAANILRNIICSGFIMNTAAVNEMRDIFVNSLHSEFRNNTLNYMDILIYFIRNEGHTDMVVSDKNTLVFQLFKDSLNRALSRNSELFHRDRLEDKIVETSKRLTQYEDSAALLDLFHFEVAKTVIKRREFHFLNFINFECLTKDNAAKIVTKLIKHHYYSEAIHLIIMSDAQMEEPVVFGLYKRVTDLKRTGSYKAISDEKLADFQEWMCNNEFDGVIEKIGAATKNRKKNKSYDWNELDHMD